MILQALAAAGRVRILGGDGEVTEVSEPVWD
jgi:hypothetical protein